MPEPTEEKSYRIVGLKVSNIKRIKAVELTPSGDIITVGGRNSQGKTSLLDSILYACAGQSSVCERPIREGQTKGEVTVDLGDLIITKTFTAASAPRLRVAMSDGTIVTSPQTILDKLCTKLAFDPMEFVRLEPSKQLDTLRKLVALDFTDLNANRQKIYDERTQTNKVIASKMAHLQQALPHHPEAPSEEVSVKALMTELSAVRKQNAANDALKNDVVRVTTAKNSCLHNIKLLGEEIQQMEALIAKKRNDVIELYKELELLNQRVQATTEAAASLVYGDVEAIENRIKEADTINSRVRSNAELRRWNQEVEELRGKERAQTSAIERIDAEKRDRITQAKFPIPELSFSDTGVLLDGLPFAQASSSRQIRASMAIAMALNPRFRIALIRNGSLLDNETMGLVTEMAHQNNIQCWIEMTTKDEGEDSRCTVVIEDGTLSQ